MFKFTSSYLCSWRITSRLVTTTMQMTFVCDKFLAHIPQLSRRRQLQESWKVKQGFLTKLLIKISKWTCISTKFKSRKVKQDSLLFLLWLCFFTLILFGWYFNISWISKMKFKFTYFFPFQLPMEIGGGGGGNYNENYEGWLKQNKLLRWNWATL
jgi:hypothetical protein